MRPRSAVRSSGVFAVIGRFFLWSCRGPRGRNESPQAPGPSSRLAARRMRIERRDCGRRVAEAYKAADEWVKTIASAERRGKIGSRRRQSYSLPRVLPLFKPSTGIARQNRLNFPGIFSGAKVFSARLAGEVDRAAGGQEIPSGRRRASGPLGKSGAAHQGLGRRHRGGPLANSTGGRPIRTPTSASASSTTTAGANGLASAARS